MLYEAQRKVPDVRTIAGDAQIVDLTERFDAIFSSMMLHWLGSPETALRRWQKFLKPKGRLFVALPVAGSFQEWRELCTTHGITDGLWPLQFANFADALSTRQSLHEIMVPYLSAHQYLRCIKAIGGATSPVGHKPASIGRMRRLLKTSPTPFDVTYRVLYIEIQSGPSN